MRARDDWRTAQNSFCATLRKLFFENLIRIVEIAENQIEAAEIIAQSSGSSALGEEPRQRNRIQSIGWHPVESFIRDDRDNAVTKDLDSRLWIGSGECFQRRQGQNEIAKRPPRMTRIRLIREEC